MKKILTILLVMMLALTACGKKSPEKVDEKKQEEKKDNEKKDNTKIEVGDKVDPEREMNFSSAKVRINAPKDGNKKGGDYSVFYEEGKKKVVLSAKSIKRVELSSIDEKFVVGSEYSVAAGSLAGSLNTSISPDSVKWEDAKFEDVEINGYKLKRFSGFKLHVSDTGKVSEGKDYFVSYFLNEKSVMDKDESTYVLSAGVNEKSLDLKDEVDKIIDQVIKTIRPY